MTSLREYYTPLCALVGERNVIIFVGDRVEVSLVGCRMMVVNGCHGSGCSLCFEAKLYIKAHDPMTVEL
jgi:hypothetical protein